MWRNLRTDIEAGQAKAREAWSQLSTEWTNLVYRLMRASFVVGLALGLLLGGILGWMMT